MNSLGSYSGAGSSICLPREVTLQKLALDWAKLQAFSIDYLVCTIGITQMT